MTSTIVIDTSTAPTTNQTAEQGLRGYLREPRPQLRFGGVLRSERIKLTSLRGVRLTMLVSVVVGLGLSSLIAATWISNAGLESISSDEDLQRYLLIGSGASAAFLSLVFGVLGVFAVSNEYSSGMILSSLTAVPKRLQLVLAKCIVLGIVATIMAFIVVGGGLLIAGAFAPASFPQIASLTVISGSLGTVAYLVLFALFAMGVAGILRSAAGGIAVVMGIAFILPVVSAMLEMAGWEWVLRAKEYIPVALGTTLGQGVTEAVSGPGYWGAFVALVVWAAAALIPAVVIFARRDAR